MMMLLLIMMMTTTTTMMMMRMHGTNEQKRLEETVAFLLPLYFDHDAFMHHLYTYWMPLSGSSVGQRY